MVTYNVGQIREAIRLQIWADPRAIRMQIWADPRAIRMQIWADPRNFTVAIGQVRGSIRLQPWGRSEGLYGCNLGACSRGHTVTKLSSVNLRNWSIIVSKHDIDSGKRNTFHFLYTCTCVFLKLQGFEEVGRFCMQ